MLMVLCLFPCRSLSLSARRAWIEIQVVHQSDGQSGVALRKESVDRNAGRADRDPVVALQSLSARRAWIEIESRSTYYSPPPVALRKESVDRNRHRAVNIQSPTGRSPQGERG